jgi:hypothetical protein
MAGCRCLWMEQFLQEGDQAGQERWTADYLQKQDNK